MVVIDLGGGIVVESVVLLARTNAAAADKDKRGKTEKWEKVKHEDETGWARGGGQQEEGWAAWAFNCEGCSA